LVLATAAPVIVAPAMNQQMFANAATQDNLRALTERGITIWGPASGDQACGDVGPGRMLEAAQLVERLIAHLHPHKILAGKRLLITAGPTREAIDPVRYISNHSSGKMGFALAQAAVAMGAQVTLVAGPVTLATPERVNRINVETAEQMLVAVQQALATHDIFIACAAVADYRMTQIASQKIKKSAETLHLNLQKNSDILAWVAAQSPRPFCVGFAAETEHVVQHAQDKLQRKQLDLICANDVSNTGLGFGSDDNAVTVIGRNGVIHQLPAQNKLDLAFAILQQVAQATG
jgi:phosphopantothenoylcysteine decarboxylase/phosphopantothenate--cysteine ligase